jgi:hypothetical protein
MKNEKYMYIFIGIVGLLAFSLVLVFLNMMQSATLTNLESGIFAIALAVFTTAIGMLFTITMANRTLNEQLKIHGKLAMRRVVQSIKSCKALLSILNSKYAATKDDGFQSKDVSNEFLENIIGQVSRLTSSIFDSREDWRDILKDERKEVDEIDKEFAELLLKYETIQNDLVGTKALLKEAKEDKPKLEQKLRDLEQENKRISEDLIKKQKKIDYLSSVWPSGISLSSSSGSSMSSSSVSDILSYPNFSTPISLRSCTDCGILTSSEIHCSKCGKTLCFNCSHGGTILTGPLCKECRAK